jgi:transcriptional regulator
MFDSDRGPHGTLVAHMALANPHATLIKGGADSVVVFMGPHGYVSPSWFPVRTSAPSWNYATAHCYGKPVAAPPGESLQYIERLVAVEERDRPLAWSLADLPAAEVERLVSKVLAFEIPLTRLEAKFELGQGESKANVLSAIEHLDARGNYALASLMRLYL